MKVHDPRSATASSDPATRDETGRPEAAGDPVVTDTAVDRPVVVAAPQTIRGESAYRLIGELGRGGAGTVYLAERADGEYRQRVALKLLRGGPRGGEEHQQRFRTERQILASLDHPCIARLLDGGLLPDGSPFLVMELVEGRRIDRYCAEEKLPARGIVELVLQVCAAVSAAHQRLVVHRDPVAGEGSAAAATGSSAGWNSCASSRCRSCRSAAGCANLTRLVRRADLANAHVLVRRYPRTEPARMPVHHAVDRLQPEVSVLRLPEDVDP